MAGGFAGSANSAGGRFLHVYSGNSPINSPLSCACWQENVGLLEAPDAKSFQFYAPPHVNLWAPLSVDTAVQCSRPLDAGWCRSSDCARLPNARGSGNAGLAHALPRDLHTVPVPHSLCTHAHHLANTSTSYVRALTSGGRHAAGPVDRAPTSRPARPVCRALEPQRARNASLAPPGPCL